MATDVLTFLQETAVAQWVSGSSSIFGYPTILTLHTVGLALLVGPSVALDLRLLGVARTGPLAAMAPLFPIMWTGLAINAVSGVLLFIADAVHKAGQPIFWIKLLCIAAAVVVLLMIRALLARPAGAETGSSPSARRLAVASLVLWTGAIVAGRLMAYQ
jgi:hypothetical protein